MSIKYRVDRSEWATGIPVGMNSILYYGTSLSAAKRIYDTTEPGKDAWNQPNAAYGVILSCYDTVSGKDVIKCSKGF